MCTSLIHNGNKTIVGWNLDILDMEHKVVAEDNAVYIAVNDKSEGWLPLFGANSRGEFVAMPTYTYAVFTVKGKMPDAFRETYRRICTEFFASSDYEYGNGAEIEVYPSADVQNPDYTCEIWIAVNHK